MSQQKDIDSFWPEDQADSIHLHSGTYGVEPIGLDAILEKAREKWPHIELEELSITPERHHTRHINYDLYDPQDYDYFLKIECSYAYLEKLTAPRMAA